MKKGRNAWFRPFISVLDVAPNSASATRMRLASGFAHRLGLLDGRLVIPGAAEHRFADARSQLGRCLGLVGPVHAEGRAASDGELVDLGGPVIQTGIHLVSPWRRGALHGCCARLVLDWLNGYRPCTPRVQPD